MRRGVFLMSDTAQVQYEGLGSNCYRAKTGQDKAPYQGGPTVGEASWHGCMQSMYEVESTCPTSEWRNRIYGGEDPTPSLWGWRRCCMGGYVSFSRRYIMETSKDAKTT
jgi:hypothetical protein